jgi:hypothetical protein
MKPGGRSPADTDISRRMPELVDAGEINVARPGATTSHDDIARVQQTGADNGVREQAAQTPDDRHGSPAIKQARFVPGHRQHPWKAVQGQQDAACEAPAIGGDSGPALALSVRRAQPAV